MTAAMSEQRPLYGIGTVARLAGIKADTLRIWERRYGLGASHKAANGRRMYTQTDLEHLQIVARLVGLGFRIGEIAGMGRKTLEALLEQGGGQSSLPEPRPRALFVGENLCAWLDRHPGCLSGLDSSLLRSWSEDDWSPVQEAACDMHLVVCEVAALSRGQVDNVLALAQSLGDVPLLVFYQFANEALLAQLGRANVSVAQLPLDTARFAAALRPLIHAAEVARGSGDAGDLVALQPRLFSDADLRRVLGEPAAIQCGCSHHLAEIIQSLLNFEEYSSKCSVENWSDAATHTCVHAYTNQARWLMEKALRTVLEEHSGAS